MSTLKEKLRSQILTLREEISTLVKGNGAKVISEVTIEQAFGGMRGVKGLVCDTSAVDPDKGLLIRGIPILELTTKTPEETFYLLCTGELPDVKAAAELTKELHAASAVPSYVWDVLAAMPKDSHPMTMIVTAISVLQKESVFTQKYNEGTIKKDQYWDAYYDDAIRLLGMLPEVCAGIYRMRFNKGARIAPNHSFDYAGNFAHMLGLSDAEEFKKMMRLYLTVHTDHEGGNVSTFASNTVASALSDVFYSSAAGLSGLAGPLHGLANQESLKFILGICDQFNGVPSDDQLKEYVWARLNSGKTIPGYGHAVLRATDPRFTAFYEFGKTVCAKDDVFKIVDKLFAMVPAILKEQGKAKNPWPNIDAGTGALLHHFGMVEFDYYTVLFGLSRVMGLCSQMIVNRMIGAPIVRPKSVTTKWIKSQIK